MKIRNNFERTMIDIIYENIWIEYWDVELWI